MCRKSGYLLLVSFNNVRLATVLLGTFKTFKTNQQLFIQAPVHGDPTRFQILRRGTLHLRVRKDKLQMMV